MHWRPHWSYSAISQYLACPLRYYFQRILCLPQPSISASLIFGSTVHEVLAEYHRSIVKTETNSVEFYRDRFRKAWIRRENESEVTYKAGENTSDLMDQGIALVELYLLEKPPEGIVAIEEEILCPVHNSKGEYLEKPLLAVADLITRKQDELTIQEFKTSGRAYSDSETESSLQPTCYVNAVQERYGILAKVQYTILVKTKTPKLQHLHTTRGVEDLGRLGDIVENVQRAIEANVFYPIESALNCSTCPYRRQCRAWGRTDAAYFPEVLEAEAVSC